MATRPRVLLVDDHPGILKALGGVLSSDCDVVGQLAEGRQVAEAAARLQPVVIVLDMHLRDISGVEVCREMAKNHPDVKIIAVSATMDDCIRDGALAAGASAFFHKSAAANLAVAIRQVWAESTDSAADPS